MQDERPELYPMERQIPDNHLVKAILTTIFCCLPLGVVAIVFAAQVNSTAASGNLEEAYRLSEKANTWGNASLIVGLVVAIIGAILQFAAGVTLYGAGG